MYPKNNLDSFTFKTSRNDRFAQMSRQEQVIEQKKREIQARLQQQKEKTPVTTASTKPVAPVEKKATKPLWKGNLGSKPNQNTNNKSTSQLNMFSNDGSFLDQFKQLNDKKSFDQKITISSIKSDKVRDNLDRSYSEERTKPSRWSKSRQSMPFIPESSSLQLKPKVSRFSEPPPGPEPQPLATFTPNPSNFTGNDLFTPTNFTLQPPAQLVPTAQMLVPPPIGITAIPPPQIQNPPQTGALIAPPPPSLSNPPLVGGISVPPPVLSVSLAELTSIPAPTPIPVHSIPAPEPLNALTIPPPAPLQLQNIPSPSPIRLNEIPNPKPIDLLNIPEPGEERREPPEFIKSVPPPNKSVPPPNITSVPDLPNISIPPPAAPTLPTLPLPPTSVPPPMHAHPPPQAGNIPALMAQPVLPPPGMQRAPVAPVQPMVVVPSLPGPPPVLNQPPPLAATNQMPPMNFPPPLGPPPTVHLNINAPPPGIDVNAVCPPGSASHDAMVSLGRMVAQCGSGIEDIVQQRSAQDPSLWFLFHKNSAAYQQYRQLVEQFRAEVGAGLKKDMEYQPEDIYEPENVTDDEMRDNRNQDLSDHDDHASRKRKRKSRWGDKISTPPSIIPPGRIPPSSTAPMLSKITRNDPGLIQYAVNTFGSTNLSEEDWNKAEDHYKINLLYQEMVRKREEIERLQKAGKNKYEYDSDEETDGGTWEHKLRMQEMEATQLWANELTRQAEGKHHIGDFLPPDELKKFMEKYSAAKEGRQPNLSDYKEFKLKEDNIGFKMLQKLGWQEGQGLGSEGTGIVEPVNKASLRDSNQGLGLDQADGPPNNDDEYDAYRKRMMLAYRFRPNPLNNPRRPYY